VILNPTSSSLKGTCLTVGVSALGNIPQLSPNRLSTDSDEVTVRQLQMTNSM
jgi:hypothetical protein